MLVVNTSQLVTLAGPACPRIGEELRNVGLIPDGAMLVRDGHIVQVGTRSEIEPQARDADVIDAGGRIVTPGFIDAHTHLVFAGNRADEFEKRCGGATYQEIVAQGGGIRSTVRKTRAATEDQPLEAANRHARWFLQGGTTTVEAKSGYGLTVEDELKILRTIRRLDEQTSLRYVPTFLGAHSIPPEFRARRDDYVSLLIDEMLPQISQQKLAEYCDVFCEENVFTRDESWRILSAARCNGLGLRIHADQ